MTIRPYTPEDKPRIIELMSEFGQYLDSLEPTNRLFSQNEGATYFANKLIDDVTTKNGAFFIAADDKSVIGFIGGYIQSPSEEEKMTEPDKQSIGVISEFFITQNNRQSGIGTKLLQAIEAFFTSKHCTHINLQVSAPNSSARNFYQKHGFTDRSIGMSKSIA